MGEAGDKAMVIGHFLGAVFKLPHHFFDARGKFGMNTRNWMFWMKFRGNLCAIPADWFGIGSGGRVRIDTERKNTKKSSSYQL